MSIKRTAQFNKIDVLVAAIISFKKNGSTILRYDSEKKIPGNKEDIISIMEQGINLPEAESSALRDEAELIISTLSQRVMLNKLTNAFVNEFLVSVTELLEKDKVAFRDFGIIAWAPKLYADSVTADTVKTTLYGLSGTSRYIGVVGTKMEIDFTCISAKFLKDYNSYAYKGHDENGNLVTFFNKNKIDNGKIVARIKAHRADERLLGARVTVLSYVKVK